MAYPNYKRGYGYSPDEDEDDLYSSNSPMTAQLSALLPRPDPEMDDRWRAAEGQALDRATPKDYGVVEGVRDFAPLAVGSFLDILVNKGRGLGTLAAGGMQAVAAQDARRDKDRHEAANEALNMKRERGAGADRMTNAYHALLRGKELENRINEQSAKSGTPEEQAETRKGERDKTQAEIKKLTADAENTGLRDIINLLSSQNQRDRDVGLQALKSRELDISERRLKADEERNTLDRDAKRSATKASNKETFNRMGKDVLAQARVLSEIEPLLIQYAGKDKPAIGPIDAKMPSWAAPLTGGKTPDAIRFQQATKQLFGWASHEITGANSPLNEREYNLISRGLDPKATDQEAEVGFTTARSVLRRTLRGLASADEEAAREVLREQGLEEWVYGPDVDYGKPQPKRPPALQPAQPGAAPPPATGELPPAAPRQPVPDQPAPEQVPTPEQKKQMHALMRQIPEEERDAVFGGLGITSDMPYEERLRLLSDEVARRVTRGTQGTIIQSGPANIPAPDFTPTAPTEPAPETGAPPAPKGPRVRTRGGFEGRRRKGGAR